MSLLLAENISKSYGDKTLFTGLGLVVENKDKIGLIGVNGTGKSSLLDILAGIEPPDEGSVTRTGEVHVEYLRQDPDMNPDHTILQEVFHTDTPLLNVVRSYEVVSAQLEKDPGNVKLQGEILKITDQMNAMDAWNFESKVKTVLTKLGVHDFDAKISTLSGGQKKRVALAGALVSPCDLLILDEPTNHLDNDTIQWLENYLLNLKTALIMITHDRYFLDRVVNRTIELDLSGLYSYDGNYSYFVEKKAERREMAATMERKRLNLYRSELAWIRAGVQGRGTKQKARIQRFQELKHTSYAVNEEQMEISVAHRRLGGKVLEIEGLAKAFDQPLFDNFSYVAKPGDRVGIVGANGAGKSTLLNILTGKLQADAGQIDIGSTVELGYFSQLSEEMDVSQRPIDYIRDQAEFVTTADGMKITAAQMMERFLFDKNLQWTRIDKLSGGERRRLYLLAILMRSPNILILDEPTNDLDIDTLKVLEGYLDDFKGIVITVSHDRYFLDRTCNMIWAFEPGPRVIQHVGNYSDYVVYREENLQVATKAKEKPADQKTQQTEKKKVKLSYKEKRELEELETTIPKLEDRLEQIEAEMVEYASSYGKLAELTEEKDAIEENLLFKLERLEELQELA